MKNYITLIVVLASLLLFTNSSCDKPDNNEVTSIPCTTTDWTGVYTGRDFIRKVSNDGSELNEPSVEVNVEITNVVNSSTGSNLEVMISIEYDSVPTVINLTGTATCAEVFQFLTDGDFRPSLVDAIGSYTLEYAGTEGSYLNQAQDVLLEITETKTYDDSDLSSQNYVAYHEIKLDSQ